MKQFKNLLALSVFSLMILALPSIASAQWGNNDDNNRNRRNDDYYGRNNRNDNYGNNNRNNNMRDVLRRLKDNTRSFVSNLDRQLDNSRYDGRHREDSINSAARDFRNAVNRLDSNSNGYGNRNNHSELQAALNQANRLENALRRTRLGYNVQNQWNYIRQDLNMLANYNGYNNDPYNRGRNNRQNTNGNWRDAIPFPLPF